MFKQPYTAEQIDFIQLNCSKMTAAELVVLFNQTFNENRTKSGLQYLIQSRGWTTIKRPNTWADGFTAEQKDFMRQYAPDMSRKELTEFFNAFFGIAVCLSTIKSWCARHKLPSPNGNGRFTSETSLRWQKGLSADEFKTHYSEESLASLLSPMLESNKKHKIGDEIIRHGVPYIIINEEYGHGIDHRIKLKSHYIWEQHHGEVPADHMIIHLDNDPMNCDISNLRCIPKKYRSVPMPAKWTKAGSIMADDFSIGWRLLDAQHFGVAQRRRRMFVVADFGGQCGFKILSESEGLSGYAMSIILNGLRQRG